MKSGFTLIEVIIVIAIISLLTIGVISWNFFPSLFKGRDAKRKQDLEKLTRIVEDYYNDQNSYPQASSGKINDIPWGGTFSPYTTSLPKDPLSPRENYYYDSGPTGNYFAIFAKLENTDDADIAKVGCTNLCGPDIGNQIYHYVVHSANVRMENGVPVTN